MNEIGLNIAPAAECITPWAPGEAALTYVKSLGCSFIQLDYTQFRGGKNFTVEEVDELAEALKRCGLRGETMSTWPEGMTSENYVDYLMGVAAAAPKLGLKVMNTYIWPFIGRADDETIGNYVRALKGVLKIAADSGLIITIEPEAHDVSRDVAGLKKILAAVDHSAFKINYDPCNIYQGMEEAFPYAYFELREHIAYVHLKNGCIFREGIDPSGEKGTRFAPPWNGRYIRWGPIDQGALNVGQIIKQLVLDGYEGVVGLEPHTGNKAKRRMCFEREVAFVRRQVELARE